jgi:AraC family transcriptional regulator of adaptative response/methylated-DNA-[protein]-cysteine methyltransferase
MARMVRLPKEDEMYRALVERDVSYEGVFLAAIKSTKIFCRPTCAARKPLRENVEYFADARAAERAGYRACKRCRPLESAGERPRWVERLISILEKDPSRRIRDEDLRALEIEPARARRHFREHFGMTFQAYQRARRLGFAQHQLKFGSDVSSAVLDAGYESESGFRDAFQALFGEPPRKVRAKDCLYVSPLPSPVGLLITAATSAGVCMLEFADRPALMSQAASLRRWFDEPIVPGTNRRLDELHSQLDEYFKGQRQAFYIPLAIAGTPFQRRVWERLLAIPYGETRSYRDIAGEIDNKGAVRAVGRSNGLNRISIVVPCHRVVRDDGTLCGYGGGLWRKRWLLEHEQAVLAKSDAAGARSGISSSRASDASRRRRG